MHYHNQNQLSPMLAEEFVADLRRRLDRLHKCRYHWKQYMIIRGILLQYNRFTRQHPYHKYILPVVDTMVLRKCRTFLHTTKSFHRYTTEEERYLLKYFIPTTQRTIQSYYERKTRLLHLLALKGLCSDLRRHVVELLY